MSDGDDEGYIRKDNVSSRNTTDQDKSSIKKNKTTCWSCGKGTEVSFEPDGRRPIYCKECLEKVKAGEDVGLGYRPVAPIIQSKTDTVNQQSALSELGIEFKGTKQPRRVETPQTVGLDEAFNKEPVSFRRKKRAEVDLKGLRATLEEAMGKKE
ncbi:hypothetical protein KKE13_00665 [Patescibacteria group bacterium]|nr:hypothetical protein [Patescibacteria group bacterium]